MCMLGRGGGGGWKYSARTGTSKDDIDNGVSITVVQIIANSYILHQRLVCHFLHTEA